MKNLLLSVLCTFALSIAVQGQWTPITIGNTNTEPVTISGYSDTIMVGFSGDGIYKTSDLGNSWIDISGDLVNKYINRIQPGPWPSLFVSTNNGPYFTINQETYVDASSTGLTNMDICFFYVGGELDDKDFNIGTNGGGFFTGPELNGPWSAANNGLTEDALNINDIGGYDFGDSSIYIIGTNAGIYYSDENFTSWSSGNNGLSGEQLQVTGVLQLSTLSFITTHSGCHYSVDKGQTWITLVENGKFNVLLLKLEPGGAITAFVMGELSYVTTDFVSWIPFSTPGEVISAATTSGELFIGTSSGTKNNTTTGGLYRQPISWIISALPEKEYIIKTLLLDQNYPNPFSDFTSISYTILQNQEVDLRVYDLFGREVMVLENCMKTAGKHKIVINANDLESGIYFVVLKANGTTFNRKIVKE